MSDNNAPANSGVLSIQGDQFVTPGSVENDAHRRDSENVQHNRASQAVLHDGSVLRATLDPKAPPSVERHGATIAGVIDADGDQYSTQTFDTARDSFGRPVDPAKVDDRTMISIGGMKLTVGAAKAGGLINHDGTMTTDARENIIEPVMQKQFDKDVDKATELDAKLNPQTTHTTDEFEAALAQVVEEAGPRIDLAVADFAAKGQLSQATIDGIVNNTNVSAEDLEAVARTFQEEAALVAVDAGVPEDLVEYFAHFALSRKAQFSQAVQAHAMRDPSKWAELAGMFLRSPEYEHIMKNGGASAITWTDIE